MVEQGGDFFRVAGDSNPRCLQGADFFFSTAAAAFNDGTGVPHAFSGRSRLPGDKRRNRFGHPAGNEVGCALFIRAADFANQDHLIGVGVRLKKLEDVRKTGAVDGITANAHASAGAHASLAQGKEDFIGEGT